MGWFKDFVRNPVGTVLNTAKEVVTDPGKVLNDIGKTIDQSIIKPIENDPLTFIVAAAAYAYGIPGLEFAGAGSAASVGVATTGSRLAQGDEFDQAVKKGVTAAAVTATVNYGRDYYRQNVGSGAPVPVESRPVSAAVDASASAPVEVTVDPAAATSSSVVNPTLVDVPIDANVTYVDPTQAANPFAPVKPSALSLEIAPFDPNPAPLSNAPVTNASSYTGNAAGQSPQGSVYKSEFVNLGAEPPYVPGSGNQAATGTADKFVNDPSRPDLIDPVTKKSPLQVKVDGTPGLPEVVDYSRVAGPDTGALSLGSVGDTALAAGENAWSFAKAHPYYTAGGLYLASQMGKDEPQPDDRPTGTPSEQIGDSRFYMSLPQLRMKRDYQEYAGDYNRYGQETGTHKFFTDPVYEPIDYTAAKDGGYVRMEDGGYMGGGGLSPQIGAPMPQQQMPQMQQAPMPQMSPMQQQQPVGALAGLTQKRPTAMPQQPAGALQKVPGQQQNPNYRYFNYGMVPPSVQPNMPQAQMSQKYATGGLTMAMANGGNVSDGRTDDIPALLSPGEYVMDAETVALLGNGNNDAGAKRLDHMREAVRKQKGGALSKGKISPDAQSPLSYLSGRMA